uniref:Granaticin polyketide synthase putative ketoacyl reductase 2 n=1 Tax=Aceria tosichella TaxID=561515 RepID=A0A6G1SHT5_9ACAR
MSSPKVAKVALVTGSSSGIGEASVKLFSQKGYNVVVCGSRQEKVDRVVEECAKLSPQNLKPLALVLDFSVAENGKLAVERTIEHFGRLDVLVNNAGIFVRSNGQDPDTYDVYRQVMTINTDATVQASLAAVEHLKKTQGNMIFVSSVASTKPTAMGYAYCMSKAAMSSFAKCLAIDVSPHIRVNIVSPGPVKTPIFERVGLSEDVVSKLMANTTLQQRVGTSEEIAETIYFLASVNSSFIHGHELFIDGGYLLTQSANSAVKQILEHKKATQEDSVKTASS